MKKILAFLSITILTWQICAAQTCGTTNIALSKTTSSSSHADQYSVSSMAVDGSLTTPWKSGNGSSETITIDLGQSYSICQVKLNWPTQFYYAAAYTLHLSADYINWTTYKSISGGDGGNDVITESGTGRYIRLTCTQKGAGWADRYELNELEVYEATSSGNNAPVVSITSPSNGSSYTTGSNVTVTADASDNDGNVVRVAFYNGATLLHVDSTQPYSYALNSIAAGTYNLIAKAIDDDNAETTSATVSITVGSAGTAWLATGNHGINPANNFIGTTDTARLIFKTRNLGRLFITSEGRVLVNTSETPHPDAHFAVKGNIWAMKLRVTQDNWADFVFDSNYRLRPLSEVEQYISRHKHLPDVPSAEEIKKDGLSVGDNQAVLLRKIEELTLYLIEQDKKIKQLEAEVRSNRK